MSLILLTRAPFSPLPILPYPSVHFHRSLPTLSEQKRCRAGLCQDFAARDWSAAAHSRVYLHQRADSGGAHQRVCIGLEKRKPFLEGLYREPICPHLMYPLLSRHILHAQCTFSCRYENPDIAMFTGQMLRECSKKDPLAKIVLSRPVCVYEYVCVYVCTYIYISLT